LHAGGSFVASHKFLVLAGRRPADVDV